MTLRALLGCLLLAAGAASLSLNLIPVTIVHINDFHAKFEETEPNGGICKNRTTCIGGYARVVTVVKRLLKEFEDQHVLYLNAGDNFQGSPWYNHFRWNVTSHFLNLLPADAMTIGNHEFDDNIAGLLPFIDTIKSPVVLANIDEPSHLVFKEKVKGAVIINKQGLRIGVIGIIFKDVPDVAKTSDLVFLDEVETVKKCAADLKQKGVNITLVLSHSGIELDRKIAEEGGPNIDVIIGGHSHTYMYSGNDSKGPDAPKEPYPLVVTQNSTGRKVLIVQAGVDAKYVGVLKLFFDNNGEVMRWDGNPIYLEHDIPQDDEVEKELQPWKKEVDCFSKKVVGSSKKLLLATKCMYEECALGNLITDSIVEAFKDHKDKNGNPLSLVAIYNSGGIRNVIQKGNITYGDALSIIPFGNSLEMIAISGGVLREALEYSVSQPERDFLYRNFLQVSGLQVTYDIRKPVGQRVTNLKILVPQSNGPMYVDVMENFQYNVLTNDFLVDGGDGYTMIKNYKKNIIHGPLDIETFVSYINKTSPIEIETQGRTKIIMAS